MIDIERLALGAAVVAASVWCVPARSEDAAPADVNVRGARRSPARAPKDASVAGAVIGRDELAAPGLALADALRSQVGVQVSETGGAGAPATASIRGATAAQVPVYLAGVRLNDDVAGTADLSRVPLWLIDRVEIYRGDAPIEADRLGIGGAIFVEPRWPRRTEAGAGATIGSWGTRGAYGYASIGDDDGAVLAGVSAEGAANDYPFTDDHGTLLAPTGTTQARLTNADVTTYDGWALGRARLGDRGAALAFVNGTTREQGAPTLALVPSRAARASFDRAIAGTRAVTALDDRGDAAIEAETSLAIARSVYSDPFQELALAAKRVALVGRRVEQRLGARAALGETTLRASIEVSHESLARDEDDRAALRADRLSSRLAIAARQGLVAKLSAQALGAIECEGTWAGGAPSTCDRAQPQGRAGLAWTDGAWEAFANVGRYARVPALGELYGMAVVVRGNAALRPETGDSIDAGVRGALPDHRGVRGAWGALAAFVRWSGDLVSFVRSSEGYVQPLNVARARVAGVEAQAGTGILHGFEIDVAATALDPRDTSPGRLTVNDVLPFQARLVVAPRASFELRPTPVPFVRRARLEARWIYQSSRYADAAGLAVIPDQSALDLALLAQSSNEVWTLRLRAADVLDAPRFDVVGFPLPGRSLFLGLEARW